MAILVNRVSAAYAAVGVVGAVLAGPVDLPPIDICLTVGHPHPCVEFSDANGDGWAIVDVAPGETYPSLPEGTEFRVTGVFCPDCVHWFCGNFVGNIFQANIHPTCLIGDLDEDGAVNGADLGALLLAWGACPRGDGCLADVDGNGVVDGADLGMLLLNWTE